MVRKLMDCGWCCLHRQKFSTESVLSQLSVFYWAAVIDLISPKILITFCDNNWKFQALSRLCKKSKFIAIQNGVRSAWNFEIDAPREQIKFNGEISMPLLFTHGRADIEMYEKYGARIDMYIPIGSLRSSWFYEMILPTRLLEPYEKFQVLLISQWEAGYMLGNQYPELRKSIKITCYYLNSWLSEKRYSFAIALRTNNPVEVEFYRQQMPNVSINFIEKNNLNMNSYFFAYLSDLIISLDSTLGREAYGWGKKVLFANFTGSSLYKTPVANGCYVDIPSYDSFCTVIDALWNEESIVYKSRTSENRKWIMQPPRSSSYGYSHKMVRNFIKEILSS